MMSRSKLRNLTDICADCGTSDPTWASINRGIFLCDECCSIHRSLGRHVSQVLSLKKGHCNPTRLQMVQTLSNNGANSIWEHTLLDPLSPKMSRKKPHPKDPLHPVKADFIKAKHQMLAFVFKPGKDDTLLLENDLSKQLHSSVRTGNLETSLRLLSQGADPNFFHPEKCTTPLHVAAKAGQILQVELLVVYGADPGGCDNLGKTPIDYARMAGFTEIENRLIECMYELTDKLAFFLCNRKPDHYNGQHFIIPEMSDLIFGDMSKDAKKKLQELPNHLFEELAMDVYDEVDRRDTESIWMSLQQETNSNLDCNTVPFLPVNPEFSSTRNQGRQKLARFNAREFATLIIDILSDAKRRQNQNTISLIITQEKNILAKKSLLHSHCKSEISDEEPLYDSVASDEDYLTAEQIAFMAEQAALKSKDPVKLIEKSKINEKENIIEEEQSPINHITPNVENLKKQLNESEYKMSDLKSKIRILNSTVQKLISENRELRVMLQQAGFQTTPITQVLVPNGHEMVDTEPVLDIKSPRTSAHHQRPASMYEPREGFQHRSWDKNQKRDPTEYESPTSTLRQGVTQSMYQCATQSANDLAEGLMRGMPLAEEVKRRTDQLTKRIQELWTSMQSTDIKDSLVPCAERIRVAVAELTAIFPQNIPDENIRNALRQLNLNTGRLQTECASLKKVLTTNTNQQVDHTYYLHQVRSCAYEMASATKQLVTKFQL